MSELQASLADPRMADAIAEIQQTVLARYPGTTFKITSGEDPGTVWMWATVDVDDSDEVYEFVEERLLDLLLKERVPVHFIPIWTQERNDAYLRERSGRGRALASTGTAP